MLNIHSTSNGIVLTAPPAVHLFCRSLTLVRNFSKWLYCTLKEKKKKKKHLPWLFFLTTCYFFPPPLVSCQVTQFLFFFMYVTDANSLPPWCFCVLVGATLRDILTAWNVHKPPSLRRHTPPCKYLTNRQRARCAGGSQRHNTDVSSNFRSHCASGGEGEGEGERQHRTLTEGTVEE